MEENILIIGNGFDIGHKLKTRYSDFIEYIRKLDKQLLTAENIEIYNLSQNNGFIQYFLLYGEEVEGWIDCEKLIRDVCKSFQVLFKNPETYIYNSGRIHVSVNSIDEKRIQSTLLLFPLIKEIDNQFEIEKKYFSSMYGISKDNIINLLKQQLDDVITILKLYLNMISNDESVHLKQIESIEPDLVINFNYTQTYKRYNIPNVLHIHGSIHEDNMVLGFDDEDENNLDFIYFKKYFQRIQKRTGHLNKDMFTYLRASALQLSSKTIYFYGHSLDVTDRDLINFMIEHAAKSVIFYLDDKDYACKVVNLIACLGKDKAVRMIQDDNIEFKQIENQE